MNEMISQAWRFKGRVITYAVSAFCPAFIAVLMAGKDSGDVTWMTWVIAVGSGLAAAAATLKGLFDQAVDTVQEAPGTSPSTSSSGGVGGIRSLAVGLLALGAGALPWAAPVVVGTAVVVAGSGCQSTKQTLLAQVAVTLAVERVVQDHPERAAKTVAICDEVARLAAGDTATTVDVLILLVRSRIDYGKLTPGEQTAVNLLLAAVAEELNARVEAGAIPVDQLWRVGVVAGWIRDAAVPYVEE